MMFDTTMPAAMPSRVTSSMPVPTAKIFLAAVEALRRMPAASHVEAA